MMLRVRAVPLEDATLLRGSGAGRLGGWLVDKATEPGKHNGDFVLLVA
jgi:hypothetical protein